MVGFQRVEGVTERVLGTGSSAVRNHPRLQEAPSAGQWQIIARMEGSRQVWPRWERQNGQVGWRVGGTLKSPFI